MKYFGTIKKEIEALEREGVVEGYTSSGTLVFQISLQGGKGSSDPILKEGAVESLFIGNNCSAAEAPCSHFLMSFRPDQILYPGDVFNIHFDRER